jgi:uncharacterized protein
MSALPKTHAQAGGWIQTFTGRSIHPANPSPDEIHIEDIANALARQCRFGGHCLRFYSVAEHCVLLCDHATGPNKFAALMHDASEAYLADIPRPIKPILTQYHAIERHLMAMIADKYGFAWPLPDEVKYLDTAIITDERQQNMARMAVDADQWGAPHPALGVMLQFWTPEIATFEFMARFYQLSG